MLEAVDLEGQRQGKLVYFLELSSFQCSVLPGHLVFERQEGRGAQSWVSVAKAPEIGPPLLPPPAKLEGVAEAGP